MKPARDKPASRQVEHGMFWEPEAKERRQVMFETHAGSNGQLIGQQSMAGGSEGDCP